MDKFIAKEKREHDARKRYHKSCRKMIAYQIDEYKANNPWRHGAHLDHDPYSFGIICDIFRSCLMRWQGVDILPRLIIDYTTTGAMWRTYHESVAEYKVVDAKDNLSKASKQTRKNMYGLTIDEYNDAVIHLTNKFDELFGVHYDKAKI